MSNTDQVIATGDIQSNKVPILHCLISKETDYAI